MLERSNMKAPMLPSDEREKGFWEYHLGTDRQWGAFLWCVACVFYGAAEAVLLVSFTQGYDDDLMGGGGTTVEEINASCQLVAAALFLPAAAAIGPGAQQGPHSGHLQPNGPNPQAVSSYLPVPRALTEP